MSYSMPGQNLKNINVFCGHGMGVTLIWHENCNSGFLLKLVKFGLVGEGGVGWEKNLVKFKLFMSCMFSVEEVTTRHFHFLYFMYPTQRMNQCQRI